MKKENSTESGSGLVYEGFCIDLLNELRAKLQFEYELQLREEFGERQPDGSWDGMIGELTKKVNTGLLLVKCFFITGIYHYNQCWYRPLQCLYRPLECRYQQLQYRYRPPQCRYRPL